MVCLLALVCTPGSATPPASDPIVTVDDSFHARVPLGIEGFQLQPSRRLLYLMGTANSPVFEGWRMNQQPHVHEVLAADGSRVLYYPARVQFRVTATALVDPPLLVDSSPLTIGQDLNSFLLSLGFRLKIFHGLQVTTLQPGAIDMIGVPADVSYDERIFRASFTLPQTPIDDRIVLEVLAPDGSRLCKFHLEF